MKTPNRNECFRPIAEICAPLLAVAFGVVLFLGVPGKVCAATTQATASADPPSQRVEAPKPASSNLSEGVSEILKMAGAGVASEVIKAYIECSAPTVQLAAADVIALKQHQVADEVVTLMIKRGAQARAVVAQVRKDNLALRLDSRLRATGGFDPEGYDYFQAYYLQPRALASGYQRLAPYYFHPRYSYGYRSPFRR